jgi:hypothetical protein
MILKVKGFIMTTFFHPSALCQYEYMISPQNFPRTDYELKSAKFLIHEISFRFNMNK